MAQARPRIASLGPGFLGGIAIFCGFAVVAWLFFRFAAPEQTYEQKRRAVREQKLAALRQEEQQKLYSAPKWTDKAKGTVQLPVDEAMDLVANEYRSKPVQPSNVQVEIPYPFGLQAPAPAASSGNAPDVRLIAPKASPPPVGAALPAGSPASTPASITSAPGLPPPANAAGPSVTTAPVQAAPSAPSASPEVKKP